MSDCVDSILDKYISNLFLFLFVQYENQVNIMGMGWTNKGPLLTRPKFSDSQGKVSCCPTH